jgi:phosphoribosylamine--glycine ligase
VRGDEIGGTARAAAMEGVAVFQAATERRGQAIVANGGRVLVMTGLAPDLLAARDRAYAAVKAVDWRNGYYRNDIGARALERKP